VRQEKNELPGRQSSRRSLFSPVSHHVITIRCVPVVLKKRQDVEQLLLAVDAVVFFSFFFLKCALINKLM
jgi:hypothetical protein